MLIGFSSRDIDIMCLTEISAWDSYSAVDSAQSETSLLQERDHIMLNLSSMSLLTLLSRYRLHDWVYIYM